MGATGRDLHIDVPLSNVAENYRPENMVGPDIAPVVPVQKQSNSYNIWSQADALRTEDDKRSPGGEAKKITRSVSSGTYFCNNYALKFPLTLEDRENMDPPFIQQMRNGKVEYIKDKLHLNWEYRLAVKCTDSTYVGSYSTVASDWMDYTSGNSDPKGDCETAIYNVQDLTTIRPNSCLMGELAWRHFRRHEDIIDVLYGNSGTGKVRYASREQFKELFELERFNVGAAYYNTAEEGLAASYSQLWGDFVLFYYAPMRPSTERPSYMYSFRWQRPAIPNMQAEVHPFDTKTKSEEVELGYYQDEKVTGVNLSFLLTHVTSV